MAVVTVSVDREGYAVVKPFLKRHGLVHLKAYLDPKYNLKRNFGYGGLPTTVLIDAQGRVVGMMVGSADLRYHVAALTLLCATLWPRSYMIPRLNWASASPASANGSHSQ